LFEDIKHKLHACCHGLHATIEALREAKRTYGFAADEVSAVAIRTSPRWLKVCDVKRPRTGLEAKFSYNMVTAMTLSGVDTASDTVYADALCRDSALTGVWLKVTVVGDEAVGDAGALVRVEWGRGRSAEVAHDLATRLSVDALERGLRAKATALIGAATADAVWNAAAGLEMRSARDLAAILRGVA
jgi:2-methylcitrate dehydratase PrpD